ncbi:MAG TPA: glycine cleavage system protein GcvH [Chryseobacterium sp.]|uniref:glycine cleavage system protein GcvH n=1 Tax=Chryseobacterium sp. CCH4-E10 TaxID=1768758 RepID=UPI00082E25B9|nr:glycine cleavage system protein GcvH [Chryseobacterium sp. CCH4-E10]HCN48314.1 glycine cleavage system protein GcvH [Chryseobacterium sp.]HQX20896.1 glycine cleavage system protein GcvH [Niabella sp.]HRB48535.1 glycine cleavage system protein GcvH [Niabella sp.]HRB88469.1 glycine cleavage system protein GcvH [Niabella sp.]HRC06294.1 glycine cleavage system protein GcvH [Niabella sp.]
MEFPNDLKYSKEHTWISVQDNTGTIGITAFAQSELGEIVYADLPNVGYNFQQDEVFGSVEAVKTVSDLFMPVSGKIIETNDLLLKAPTLINDKPYKDGWLIKIEIKDITELENLLTSNQYKELTN